MYFLTKKDPNYTIKGSRDPLGLQVIWQAAGKKVIPHISTVSNTIIDFQIMALAYVLKEELKIHDNDFDLFFLRFEQLMAYTRFQKAREEGLIKGFNGIDKVRKIMTSDDRKEVMVGKSEKLLSNQKSYGIWGKYNRPFTEMGFLKNKEFMDCFRAKVAAYPKLLKRMKVIAKKEEEAVSYVKIEELKEWEEILDQPIGKEREWFIKIILQDKFHDEFELLNIINEHKDTLDFTNLYSLLKTIEEKSNNEYFSQMIQQIIETEKTICPLNRIFRHLQTKSFWKIKELEEDGYIKEWRNKIDTVGFGQDLKGLALLHQGSNLEMVKGIVARNEKITQNRHSSPWLTLEDDGLTIHHYEGVFTNEEYNPEQHTDFNYFFNCYIQLYGQLN